MSETAAVTPVIKKTKVFRPYRVAVRAIMKSVDASDDSKHMIRGGTLDILEDVVLQANKKLAERMGTIVDGSGRSKISLDDAKVAVELEFGPEFAELVMNLAKESLASAEKKGEEEKEGEEKEEEEKEEEEDE